MFWTFDLIGRSSAVGRASSYAWFDRTFGLIGEEARDTTKVEEVVTSLNEVIDCFDWSVGAACSASRAHNCKLCSVVELHERLDSKSMEIKWY